MVRESATLVMLIALAVLAGSRARERWGAFLVAFSAWDLSYYLFLRIIDGWPNSLFTRDVFFLLPVPSIGPVLTPLVMFSVALVVGVALWTSPRAQTTALDPDAQHSTLNVNNDLRDGAT